jgi:hypothetical protein
MFHFNICVTISFFCPKIREELKTSPANGSFVPKKRERNLTCSRHKEKSSGKETVSHPSYMHNALIFLGLYVLGRQLQTSLLVPDAFRPIVYLSFSFRFFSFAVSTSFWRVTRTVHPFVTNKTDVYTS